MITFKKAFITKYPKYGTVYKHMCKALGRADVCWDDFTKVNLIKITDYINDHLAANSACTYLAQIKSVLNDYSEEHLIPCASLKGLLKGKKVPSQHVALTWDEVLKFDSYTTRSWREEDIKNLFMRECLTGARTSDAVKFSLKNIVGNNFVYVSKKTKEESVIPVTDMLRKYISRPIKVYSRKTNNETVKRICEDLGITYTVKLFVGGKEQRGKKSEFIQMHTGRRTFCSVLAREGVNIVSISKMAGHTSTAMTDRYIVPDARQIADDVRGIFESNASKAQRQHQRTQSSEDAAH